MFWKRDIPVGQTMGSGVSDGYSIMATGCRQGRQPLTSIHVIPINHMQQQYCANYPAKFWEKSDIFQHSPRKILSLLYMLSLIDYFRV